MIIKNKKKIFSFFLALFIGGGVFFLVPSAHADVGDWAGEIIGGLIGWIISAFGLILVLVMKALVLVAQYSNFIGSPAVSNGWKMVRDVCNMFFVLVLLIIAFATILKIENYSYKKWLPKLILMAILINFSKTICGLLIDFTQVIMLTFVNAFKDIAAGNLITNLGITDILTLAQSSGNIGFWEIVGSYVLGLIYIIIALVVIVTMLAMLVMRIVMIWIYVVLSPAAYLLSAFPGGQKYASQWWTEFTKNLIVGPVLAFFIWLSFTSLQAQDSAQFNTDFKVTNDTTGSIAAETGLNPNNNTGGGNGAANADSATGTKAATSGVFIKFIIAIGMLIGGLKISQEIGGAAGGIAGKGMAKIQQGAAFVGKKSKEGAKNVGAEVGRRARNTALGVGAGAIKLAGTEISKLGPSGGKLDKTGQFIKSIGGIGLDWRSDMIKKNDKRKQEKRQKFLEKMGMGEKTMEATNEFLKKDSGKNFTNVVGATGTGAILGAAGAGPVGAVVGGAIGATISGLQALSGWLGKKINEQGDNQKAKGNNARGNILKFIGDGLKSAQTFTTETTQKAAAKGGKEITDAKNRVHILATDKNAMKGANGFSPKAFYSKSGQESMQKKNFEQLVSTDNPESSQAINNLDDWAKSYNYGTDKDEDERMEALIKGIAAFKKGGGDTSRLSSLISTLDSKGTLAGTVSSQESKVIANRKTGQIGEKGSGKFAVDTFAKNNENEAGKNVIGVDFDKIKGAGIDVNAEANFSSGEAMGPIIEALKAQISEERSRLNELGRTDSISDKDFTDQHNNLDKVEERLNDPNLKNLNLVNTASANYGRQERLTSVYHEEVHAGGVVDEDLTEKISKNLMANKLYGRNAATGGRHATEIAQKAKVMKDEGKSNDEIMAEVDKEVKSRVSSEGKNRAERVVKKERGEKETESEAVSEKSSDEENKKSKSVEEQNIDLEKFQKSVDDVAERINGMNFTSVSVGRTEGQSLNNNLLFQLRQLNKNVRNLSPSIQKAISGTTPETIVEISAINDEINKKVNK